jgi:D-sedoheptulose 7-phosphate isomerase
MKKRILQSLTEHRAVHESLRNECGAILRVSDLLVKAFQNGRKLLVVGNGGAASDAAHLAAELVATFTFKRRGLPAICLSSNVSTITAWTNDFSFDTLYERQVEAFGRPGDVFLALSSGGGSLEPGRSANIALAAKKAKEMGLVVIGFTGKTGGALKKFADPCIIVKSQVTARIQEAHMTLFHVMIDLIDEKMFGKDRESRRSGK